MNQQDRLKAFETERDQINREFYQGLIEPASFDILARRLSDKYVLLIAEEEKK